MENFETYKNQPMDIVIQGGQSNAEGAGRGDAKEPYVPDERILYLNPRAYAVVKNYPDGSENMEVSYPEAPVIEIAAERKIGEGKGEILSDFSLSFAREYLRAGLLGAGRKLLIIRAAVGGTGFAKGHWTQNGILYRKLLALTDSALSLNPGNKLVAFLWHQGECDAFEFPDRTEEERYQIHFQNLKEMLVSVLNRYNVPDLPIVTGGIIKDWRSKYAKQCDAVEKAIRDVCALLPSADFAESDGLLSNDQATGNGDDIHFCRDSLMELGKRYFEKYRTLITKKDR